MRGEERTGRRNERTGKKNEKVNERAGGKYEEG